MMRLRFLLIAALTVWGFTLPAFAQDAVPPQMNTMLDSLSQYVGRRVALDELRSWNYSIALYTDTALGCAIAPSVAPLPNGIQGYTFTFDFQGIAYDWRVAEDGSIAFPCDATLLAGAQVTAPPVSSSQTSGILPATSATPSPCPPNFEGYLTPQVGVGGQGRIEPGGTPNRVRDLPGISGAQIGLINAGTVFDIIGGPSCDAQTGVIWWLVDTGALQGWTAEGVLPDDYYIEPLGEQPAAAASSGPVTVLDGPLPDERSIITADALAAGLTPLGALRLETSRINDIAFNADMSLMAVAVSESLNVYRLPELEQVASFPREASGFIGAVAFHPDNVRVYYASIAPDRSSVMVADVTTNTSEILLRDVINVVNTIAVSPDGTRLVLSTGAISGGNPQPPALLIVDLETDSSLLYDDSASVSIFTAGYSPDGTLIAYVGDSLRVVDAETFEEVLRGSRQSETTGWITWVREQPPGGENVIAFADGSLITRLDAASGEPRSFDAGLERPEVFGTLESTANGDVIFALGVSPEAPNSSTSLAAYDVATGDAIAEFTYETA
ncbi:MAG: hypothetical protein HC828_19365, partial [Blastochloris sp.]|nr:hypothetical protein [Blastochloris sp.]